VSWIAVMLRAALPVFSKETLWAELVVPVAWLPKDKLVDERLTEGAPEASANLDMQSTVNAIKSAHSTRHVPFDILRPFVRRYRNKSLQEGILLLFWSASGASRQRASEAVLNTIAGNIVLLSIGGQELFGSKRP